MVLKKTLLDNYYECEKCGRSFLAEAEERGPAQDEANHLDCPYCSNVRNEIEKIETLQALVIELQIKSNNERNEANHARSVFTARNKEIKELKEALDLETVIKEDLLANVEELKKELACVEERFRNRGETIKKQAIINEQAGEEVENAKLWGLKNIETIGGLEEKLRDCDCDIKNLLLQLSPGDGRRTIGKEEAREALVFYLLESGPCQGCFACDLDDKPCNKCTIEEPTYTDESLYKLDAKGEAFLDAIFGSDKRIYEYQKACETTRMDDAKLTGKEFLHSLIFGPKANDEAIGNNYQRMRDRLKSAETEFAKQHQEAINDVDVNGYIEWEKLKAKVEELNDRLRTLERPGGCDALSIAQELQEEVGTLKEEFLGLRKVTREADKMICSHVGNLQDEVPRIKIALLDLLDAMRCHFDNDASISVPLNHINTVLRMRAEKLS